MWKKVILALRKQYIKVFFSNLDIFFQVFVEKPYFNEEHSHYTNLLAYFII